MKVLFLHGFGSDPDGVRPTFLRDRGYQVVHPALDDFDFDQSLRVARQAFEQSQPDVIVGSSRGGAVTLNIDTGKVPLVLIAPAWRRWGSATTVKAHTVILHSERDAVVPIEDSRELLSQSRLAEDRLVVVGQDHRMVDQTAFGALVEAIEKAGNAG